MPNTREKLSKLIGEAHSKMSDEYLLNDNIMTYAQQLEFEADHLIANGVTVLPLKIGDVVYFPIEDYHDSAVIDGISITSQGISFTWVQYEVGVDITECWDDGEFGIDEIGKTVFLTREQAEAHLSMPPKGE